MSHINRRKKCKRCSRFFTYALCLIDFFLLSQYINKYVLKVQHTVLKILAHG
jgi:hypothetical protein